MFVKMKILSERISFKRCFNAPHKKFFWGALFFLSGIYTASVGFGSVLFPFLVAGLLLFILLSFFFRRKGFLFASFLPVFVLLGAMYYGVYDVRSSRSSVSFGEHVSFSGIVCSDPVEKESSREIRVCLSYPAEGIVLVKTKRFPDIRYGDELFMTGAIERVPENGYGEFLKKENIDAFSDYPDIEIVSSGNGSLAKRILFGAKHAMRSAAERTLSYESASFLGGILFGDTGTFSPGFKDAMRSSGTTHIVALSGYNITVLATAIMSVFSFLFSKRWSTYAASAAIAGFVVMTGASPSVVRAGIMGILLIFGRRFGEGGDVKNVLLFSALAMALHNPRILAFDIGFQLSFLAFFGIAYIQPKIEEAFSMKEKGLLMWKESFVSTVSAQIMVFPLLLSRFGEVSLISVPANVFILGFMPFTMGIGFFTLFLSLISPVFSMFPGGLLELLLQFEMGIIRFFASFGEMISFSADFLFSAGYYVFIFLLIHGISRVHRFVVSGRSAPMA